MESDCASIASSFSADCSKESHESLAEVALMARSWFSTTRRTPRSLSVLQPFSDVAKRARNWFRCFWRSRLAGYC